MLQLTHIYLAIFLAAILPVKASLESLSLAQLEERREEIGSELAQLARLSLRSGVGSIGYRSQSSSTAQQTEWIQINLEQTSSIDEIVLVPTLWRDATKGFQADGFPTEFRIIAGTANDPKGRIVREFSEEDHILPRIAPLVIATRGVMASWIRIEAIRLSPRAFDGKFTLQFSEVFVFSGSKNIALRQPVTASSKRNAPSRSWDTRFIVDGFVPYLMDSAQGQPSPAFISKSGELPALTIDLLEPHPITQIQLHTVEQGDTVPQSYAGNLGIPHHFWIEGAKLPDFSDSTILLDYSYKSLNETGPIMMWEVPETTSRYVRITAKNPKDLFTKNKQARIGFAEIVLLSDEKNVARGKPINADFKTKRINRPLSPMTDGNNLYGSILPIRTWLNQLARRHQLEQERPIIGRELARRYERQKTILTQVCWLAAILAVSICFTVLIQRYFNLRQLALIKERIAADLHDELGANIHTIGMLGDLAKEAIDSPEELIELLDQSREYTERSGVAVRHCTDMLAAEEFEGGVVEEFTRSSARILADLDHSITFEGQQFLQNVAPQRRSDLFFFYKECLINIIRHSGATKASTFVKADARIIYLSITDNGKGMEATGKGITPPPSLRRRARLLVAKVSVTTPPEGGTRITLKMKRRWWRGVVAHFRGLSNEV